MKAADLTPFKLRETSLSDDVKRDVSDPFLGSSSLLARTTVLQTYPTAAQSYYACLPMTLLGTEREGDPGIVTSGDSTFFALNIGSSVPPPNTLVVATFVGNRWVFRHDA